MARRLELGVRRLPVETFLSETWGEARWMKIAKGASLQKAALQKPRGHF